MIMIMKKIIIIIRCAVKLEASGQTNAISTRALNIIITGNVKR